MVRLTHVTIPSEGLVELYHKGRWLPVCYNVWDLTDGDVVCRQLGYPNVLNVSGNNQVVSSSGENLWINYVSCNGSEDNLKDCSLKIVNHCKQNGNAKVKCNPGE